MTLTPEQATFFAAAIAAVAALMGILVRGTVDWRLTTKQLITQREMLNDQLSQQREMLAEQLEQQREAAIAQMESQERIATASRAEERNRTMLEDRRAIYERVLGQGRELTRLLIDQMSLMHDLAKTDVDLVRRKWESLNESGVSMDGPVDRRSHHIRPQG